jgi:hypothetical protein
MEDHCDCCLCEQISLAHATPLAFEINTVLKILSCVPSRPESYSLETTPAFTRPENMASVSAARFMLIFYAPPSAVAACKAAIFKAGAGRYPGPGNYTECCWSALGTGQFRPGDAAKPHIGTVGDLEETPEIRVETLCAGEDIARQAVLALKTYVTSFSKALDCRAG